jgi:hypothetical protein
MALELTGEGDTEEDEALAHVVDVKLKQRTMIGKGKGKKQRDEDQRDMVTGQQSDRESCLRLLVGCWLTFFSASSFQPYHDDSCFPDPDPLTLDDFNVDGNAENSDEWVSDLQIVSQKNSSKFSEAMAMEVSLMLFVVPDNVNTALIHRDRLGTELETPT